jgi:hypothetical protein
MCLGASAEEPCLPDAAVAHSVSQWRRGIKAPIARPHELLVDIPQSSPHDSEVWIKGSCSALHSFTSPAQGTKIENDKLSIG